MSLLLSLLSLLIYVIVDMVIADVIVDMVIVDVIVDLVVVDVIVAMDIVITTAKMSLLIWSHVMNNMQNPVLSCHCWHGRCNERRQ